ncbi:acylphosphatase [Phenylobacterium kunshanense]|uniref:Acylphosphatase n=1 Tax=Phenylobacterium kunshanense TaxID=1445034 RepID=A0A328BJR7_9CAUL|nr:acylphosphatase [Phenylobacterium kunshanense]RAK67393.1 acylphosphatase [Phenylobacterium kunshanense]
MARVAALIRVEGRVQGVGFRWWLSARADELGLAGWVRNRRDGAVEALAIGEPAAIAQLVESCHPGPAAAEVRSVTTEPAADDGADGFEQRATV